MVLLTVRFHQHFREKEGRRQTQCHESVVSVVNVRWLAIGLVNPGGIQNAGGCQIFNGSVFKLRTVRDGFAFARNVYGVGRSLRLFQGCQPRYKKEVRGGGCACWALCLGLPGDTLDPF